ncbi:hypothetical protein [Legionella londiniensis]|uniref:Uncharacterized protein n=1 Tax=Legionella londiniensis TaxID=45068 RepID=A0A0W0VHL4_9GAMM|nr:hypothetical protein [Legionella londiniensis]KTD19586.1 hypothetical protein Llon_2166 [Legionella londiniensis]STX92191.1 Uncharacterised protein [Legionella londiniensis]
MKSLFKYFTTPPVTKVTLSSNELILALDKYPVKQEKNATVNIAEMRENTKQQFQALEHLTLETAQQKYPHESVSFDLCRDAPDLTVYKNKKEIVQLPSVRVNEQKREAWFHDTLEILKNYQKETKLVDYFSHMASQNVMNSGGNMMQQLARLANKEWMPVVAKGTATAKISANEKGMLYSKRIPIQSIVSTSDPETPVIANENKSPIACITTHLTIYADKMGIPRHRLTYEVESQNEQFRQNILQPLYKNLEKVRQETATSKQPSQDIKDSLEHWHIMK